MEIHIDTRRDSDEEIRKTIRFLQSLIGDESVHSPEAPSSPGAFNMFGDNEDSSPAPLNMFGNDDDAPSDYAPEGSEEIEEESIVEIVEY